jgi:hypothetical protein
MRVARWTLAAALAAALAVGGCGDNFGGGDTAEEDMEGGVPEGAIPAPEGTAANPAAAGVPLDSTAADSTAPTAPDSVTPELGR